MADEEIIDALNAAVELTNRWRYKADDRSPSSFPQPPRLNEQQIIRVLQRFQPMSNFYITPEIPKDKLYSAITATGVSDSIVGLIDSTFFGSAKDCVLVGLKGVYWKKGVSRGCIQYFDFRYRIFEPVDDDATVLLGLGERLVVTGVPPSAMAAILNALKQELNKQSQSVPAHQLRGLAAVAGMRELKQLLSDQVIDVLKKPDKFRRYGLSVPNGILLFGPPGCGKTYIARQLADELDYNFVEISPSDIGSMYIHGSTLKIREAFEKAANKAPSVLFIDEFEALVPARDSLGGEQQFKAEEVNEFLTQTNNCCERGILLVAATNEPWNIDPAVQRTGRLDKKLYVGAPDYDARREILLLHLRGRFVSEEICVDTVAQTSSGYSSSDLKALVDEAARFALRCDEPISARHLVAAMKKIPASILHEQECQYLDFGIRGS